MRKKIIEKIYQNEIQEPEWMYQEHLEMETKLKSSLEEYAKNASLQECERLQEKMLDIILDAEKQGFVSGFCYAINLLFECRG
ncbi:MAG: hypothetical protein ACI4F9_10360 [Lachnospiraceae bacterium]